MNEQWEENLKCAIRCSRCKASLEPGDERILSVYDHEAICMACKKSEEQRPDYPETSKQMIGRCMAETEVMWSDPGGYCYHHFYGYTCR